MTFELGHDDVATLREAIAKARQTSVEQGLYLRVEKFTELEKKLDDQLKTHAEPDHDRGFI